MSPQMALLFANKKQLGGINEYQTTQTPPTRYGVQGGEKPVSVTSK